MSPRNPKAAFEELEEFDLCSLSQSIRIKGGRDLAAKAIVHLALHTNLTLTDLKQVKEPLTPFASACWEEVAPKFGLDRTKGTSQLEVFCVPHAFLPPSFHQMVMEGSAQWLDVYQERGAHKASRVRLMDPWYVPVCALFKGRVVDQSGSLMPETPEASWGEVEHKLYMTEGIILIVVELKLQFMDEASHAARVLLELASAYKLNRTREFDPQPPVYALLTDLRMFQFYRYDGTQFFMDEGIPVPERTRSQFLNGMGDVMEKLFSVILQGYISTLQATENELKKRGEIDGLRNSGGTRPSLDNCTQALLKAKEAQKVLVECNCRSMEVWEEVGLLGLRLLEESVLHLPKIGSNTDWSVQKLEEEIVKVLSGRCKETGSASGVVISDLS